MTTFEYGAGSSKWSCEAENKLTAYATILLHYDSNNHIVVIYAPEQNSKDDQWFSFDGKVSARLDEIFGGEGSLDEYIENHIEEINACYKSIKRLVG